MVADADRFMLVCRSKAEISPTFKLVCRSKAEISPTFKLLCSYAARKAEVRSEKWLLSFIQARDIAEKGTVRIIVPVCFIHSSVWSL